MPMKLGRLLVPIALFAVVLVLIFALSYSSAQDTRKWQRMNGPYNTEQMFDLEMDPTDSQILFAGTNRGIYRTLDGGERWQELTDGISTDFSVTGIEITPADAQLIYAINLHGIYRSTDGGDSWTNLSGYVGSGLTELRALEVDPSNADTVYVGGRDASSGARTVWQTLDGGLIWIPIAAWGSWDDDTSAIEAITVSHHDPNTIYVATAPVGPAGRGRILVTHDKGRNWQTLLTGPPLDGRVVYTVVVDPVDPLKLYFGTDALDDPAGPPGLVFKSADGGTTWENIYDRDLGGLERVRDIVVDPDHPDTLYVAGGRAFGRSDDGGKTWRLSSHNYRSAGMFPPNIQSLAVDFPSQTVYSGGYGVLKSTDGGETFALKVAGLESDLTRSLKVDPFDPEHVYAITGWGYGIAYSADGGVSWQRSENGFYNNYGMLIEVDVADPDTVYATTSGGLWRSTDRGRNWEWLNNQFQNSHVHGLAIDPFDSDTLLAGVGRDASNPSGQGAFISTDRGITWENIAEGDRGFPEGVHVAEIRIDPTDPDVIYICTRGDMTRVPFDRPNTAGKGIFKSVDGGRNWVPINTGLTNLSITSLVINPYDPNILYAGAASEFHLNPDESRGGVFKSSDAGASWTPINNGLTYPQDPAMRFNVHSLAIDRSDPDVVYAAVMDSRPHSYEGAIYRTRNGGDHWELFTEGLVRAGSNQIPGVEFLDVDPTGQLLYAAMKGGPVYKYGAIPEVDDVAPAYIAGPAIFEPSPEGVTIRWTTHEASTGWVEYGPTKAFGNRASDDAPGHHHSARLTDLDLDATYHFRVGVIDASGNGPRLSGEFTFRLADLDKTAPKLTIPTQFDGTTEPGPYEITVKAEDNFGIDEVSLFYSYDDGVNFTRVAMQTTDGDRYSAEIPSAPSSGYVDYYVEALDLFGNLTREPRMAPFGTHSFLVVGQPVRPYIYVAHESGGVSLLNGDTWREESSIRTGSPATHLIPSADQDFLVLLSNSGISILDVQSNQLTDRLWDSDRLAPMDWWARGALSPGDEKLYVIRSGQGPDRVVLLDVDPLSYQESIEVGRNLVDIGVSPNGDWIYLVDNIGRGDDPDPRATDGQLIVLRARDLSQVRSIPLGRGAGELVFSSDGQYAFVLAVSVPPYSTGMLYKIDTASHAIVDQVGLLGQWPERLVINRKNNAAYVVTGNNITVVDLGSFAVVENVTIGATRYIPHASITNDDKFVLVSDLDFNRIHVLDTRSNRLTDPIETAWPTAAVSVNRAPK